MDKQVSLYTLPSRNSIVESLSRDNLMVGLEYNGTCQKRCNLIGKYRLLVSSVSVKSNKPSMPVTSKTFHTELDSIANGAIYIL
ncbi:hypothetical protein RRG08_054953 [Elysia crispata]|uniref:Uncharacterized protein n=1 Tax=Elysia crispata TaxID=231223 RepID=A0AAE0YXX1_9GAST|nr:hypothetical protein RRG08_054953 [Elysia crispata]